MVTDRGFDGTGGNPYATDTTGMADAVKDLPQAQRTIWKYIRGEIDNGGAGDEGVNLMAIARHVSMNVDTLRTMIEEMIVDGLLYSGLDDEQ
jgi:hypothetical protein